MNSWDLFPLLYESSKELLQVILAVIKYFLEKKITEELKIKLIKINIIYVGKL